MEDNCLYCDDEIKVQGELFCCEGCYHEWHEENDDYVWDEKEEIYIIPEHDEH